MSLPDDTENVILALPGDVSGLKISGVRHSLSLDDAGNTLLTLTGTDALSGKRQFHITWSSPSTLPDSNAVTITLDLLSSHWGWDIPDFGFSLILPEEFSGSPIFESGYYGQLSGQDITSDVHGNEITGSVPGGVMAYDSFCVKLSFEDGYFSVPNAMGRYLLSFRGILNLLALAAAASAFVYWLRRCRNGSVQIRMRPLPPDGATAGSLPFLLNGAQPDPAALVLEWAAAGYLTLYYKNQQVILRRRMAMGNERTDAERWLFGVLFSQGSTCQLPDAAFHRAWLSARKQIRRDWRRLLFDRRRGPMIFLQLLAALALGLAIVPLIRGLLPQGTGWTLLSLLCLPCGLVAGIYLQICSARSVIQVTQSRAQWIGVLCLWGIVGLVGLIQGAWMLIFSFALQVFVGLQSAFGEPRTRQGLDVLNQVLSFRRYILTVPAEHLRSSLRQDPMYYYRLLPWAEGLGMGREFSARFGRMKLEAAGWFNTGYSQQTAQLFYDVLSPALQALRGQSGKKEAP